MTDTDSLPWVSLAALFARVWIATTNLWMDGSAILRMGKEIICPLIVIDVTFSVLIRMCTALMLTCTFYILGVI